MRHVTEGELILPGEYQTIFDTCVEALKSISPGLGYPTFALEYANSRSGKMRGVSSQSWYVFVAEVTVTEKGQKAPRLQPGEEWPPPRAGFSLVCEKSAQSGRFLLRPHGPVGLRQVSDRSPTGLPRRSRMRRCGHYPQAPTWSVGACVA